MRTLFGSVAAVALAAALPAFAQQVVNPNPDVSVAAPAWPRGTGPRVRIDEAHLNFHTANGRYAPFAALLRNDGYRVEGGAAPFGPETLAGADIIVIANALAPEGSDSAFDETEIAALRSWVEAGGSLLLIADHAPFAGAAARLARAFGIIFHNAYAVDTRDGPDIFRSGNGLADHPIVRGAGGDAAVPSVRTFTGSAFEAPGAEPLLTLGRSFQLMHRPGRTAQLHARRQRGCFRGRRSASAGDA